jgi:hypothetical protein
MSYAIFNAIVAIVQTAKRNWVMETFEHLKVETLSRVEYESCAECYYNRARQNSAFLQKKWENYRVFGEWRVAAKTAR